MSAAPYALRLHAPGLMGHTRPRNWDDPSPGGRRVLKLPGLCYGDLGYDEC